MEPLLFKEREQREQILELCKRMSSEGEDALADELGFALQMAALVPQLLAELEKHERKDGGVIAEELRDVLRAHFMATVNGRKALSMHAGVQSFSLSVVGPRIIADVRMEYSPTGRGYGGVP